VDGHTASDSLPWDDQVWKTSINIKNKKNNILNQTKTKQAKNKI
jgi:hypothetical protein